VLCCSFWWEGFALVQRTVLTGWLLLVETRLKFIRLLIALLVSIFFLVALLTAQPYRRRLDYGLAAGVQLLFVCMFIGGLLVQLHEDISTDAAGSLALAYRSLGFYSSDHVVILMICVTFVMVSLLAITLGVESWANVVQERLRRKWSVATIDPPHAKGWRARNIYGCFLSHYKIEAASEARYMHDMLRKMLFQPVFLGESEHKFDPRARTFP
jgi:hypothetical protein